MRNEAKKADDQKHLIENWRCETVFSAKFWCQKFDKLLIHTLWHCFSGILVKNA
jgi:hypothetical protein